jgi:hypothetical protein
MGRKIDESKVVWIPPEQLDRARGEYRESLDPIEKDNQLIAQTGDLVQWVDEHPEDPENGAGHFRIYDGDEADYEPTQKGA